MNSLIRRGSRVTPWLLAAIVGIAGCTKQLPLQAYVYKVYPVDLLHGGGLAGKLNIVIVGDGFTAASLDAYRAAAQAYVTDLLAVSPFGAMGDSFNVYRVDVLSNEEGIDVPETCGSYVYPNPPPPHPQPAPYARRAVQRDTALATSWCASGLRQGITSANEQLVLDAATSSGVVPHVIIVLVNDWMYGAAAWANHPIGSGTGGIAYVSIEQNLTNEMNPLTGAVLQPDLPIEFPDVAIHETGHLGPFLLLDEYGGRYPGPVTSTVDQGKINNSPNLTLEPVPPTKWDSLIPPGTPLPTDCTESSTPDVAAAPGGFRYNTGVYHSRCKCRMNRNHDPFCTVCRRRIMAVLEPFIPPIPPATPVSFLWRQRILVDSLRLKKVPTGPGFPPFKGGHFFITATVTSGSSKIVGRWPARGQNRWLTLEKTEEPGEVLFEIPSSMSGPVIIDYQLMQASSVDSAEGKVVERRTVRLETPPESGAAIRLFDFTTHQLTLAIIAR